jgi:23S rRNA pseudouridine2604 synthase
MHINSYLVKQLKLSHQQIKSDIALGYVLIDDKIAFQKQAISANHTVQYNDQVIQIGKPLFYYAYNKPVGVESTLNLNIPNNLIQATNIKDYFFPIGRLDKASEGLMILTNDGKLYKQITGVASTIEKIYNVVLDKALNEDFIKKMAEGIEIMGVKTKTCKVVLIDTHSFQITLLEGRNRQIRRMCYKLGYAVLVLKRIAISHLNLGDLQHGQIKAVSLASIV